MGHLLGIVELVGYVSAIDDCYLGVLSVGFIDEGDCCFVVFGGHGEVLGVQLSFNKI